MQSTRCTGQDCTAQCAVRNVQGTPVSSMHKSLLSFWKWLQANTWHIYCSFYVNNPWQIKSISKTVEIVYLGLFWTEIFLQLILRIYLFIVILIEITYSCPEIATLFISNFEYQK